MVGNRSRSMNVSIAADGYVTEAFTVELEPDKAGDEIVVEMHPGVNAEGRVIDAEGRPVAYAGITLDEPLEKHQFDASPSDYAQYVDALSRPDGSFFLEDVRPGERVVWAYHPDHGCVEAPALLTPDEPAPIVIQFAAPASEQG